MTDTKYDDYVKPGTVIQGYGSVFGKKYFNGDFGQTNESISMNQILSYNQTITRPPKFINNKSLFTCLFSFAGIYLFGLLCVVLFFVKNKCRGTIKTTSSSKEKEKATKSKAKEIINDDLFPEEPMPTQICENSEDVYSNQSFIQNCYGTTLL